MHSDYILIRSTLRSALPAMRLTRNRLANQLGTSCDTVGDWIERPYICKVADMDQLLSVIGFSRVRLRQPYNDDPSILRQLVAVRKLLKIPIADIAKAVGKSTPSIYRWESGGTRGPGLGVLEKWAIYLGMGGVYIDVPDEMSGPSYAIPVNVELLPTPTPAQTALMIEDGSYRTRRYVPFSLDHTKLHIEAQKLGLDDAAFHLPHTYRGESLMLPKFRIPLLTLAIKYKDTYPAADRLIELLHARTTRQHT